MTDKQNPAAVDAATGEDQEREAPPCDTQYKATPANLSSPNGEALALLAHLHRGGKFGYWWTKAGKRSAWYGGLPTSLPKGNDIYWNVHPVAAIPDRGEADSIRHRIAEVCAVNCVFAEFDTKDFGNSKQAVLEHIAGLPIRPSAIVDSGHGYHCYWLLAETVIITDDNRLHLQKLQAAWVELVGGDDGAKDLARILRVPGTVNAKEAPVPVELLYLTDDTYKLSEIEELLPLAENHPASGFGVYLAPRTEPLPSRFASGKRHKPLLSVAGALRRQGLDYDEILAALRAVDGRGESPYPTPDKELQQLAQHIVEFNPGFDLTELGNAMRFELVYGDKVRHCEFTKSWYVWDGRRWRQDTTNEITELARQVPILIACEATNEGDSKRKEALNKWFLASQSSAHMQAALHLSKGELSIRPGELDSHRELLNVRNGVLDLRTGTLGKHDPGLFITKLIEVDYDPHAECPLWERQLQYIDGGDADTIRWVQKAVGYTLSGRGDAKILPFLYGIPDTGKSTFIETLLLLFGEYAFKVPVEILLKKGFGGGGEGPTPYTRAMMGKRCITATEMPVGATVDDGTVKELSGGDTSVGRGLHKDPANHNPTFCVWLYGNNRANVRDASGGVFTRLCEVPFRTVIPKEASVLIGEMKERLVPELPGILAWAVEGYAMFLQEGMRRPENIRKATEDYQKAQDRIGAFLEECARIDAVETVEKKLAYEWYSAWCKRDGEYRVSKNMFTQYLRGQNIPQDKGKRLYEGMGLVGERPVAA